ncbi:hypothetical protein Q8A67_002941 [Cirrhinus molitorella]|uniref:FISNA domain-containing protein n=1 Tax=Cirrhinus molitorella TaxID=172907 RepID=A0AA88Q2M7_9TELE|nr:hypothetical protein Q8A67_002941 [Cirrhinus molitorella]
MDDTQAPRNEFFSPGCSSDHQKKSEPEPSCVSLRSDASLIRPVVFKSVDTSSVHQKKSEPEPSCVSLRSDASLIRPVVFKSVDTRSILPPRTKPVCKKYGQSMNQPQDRMYPGVRHEVLDMFRSNLMKKFKCLYEGTATQGKSTLLNEIYTELYITEKINNPENMKVLQKLLPVIKESRSVQLSNSGVTDEGCAALASALRSNPSHLRKLDLSLNKLGDSVKLLSDVLQNPHCKLETLWLSNCGVTDEGCAALASALRSNPSHLKLLDLSGNKLGDSVKLLSDVLQNPHCKLETLWLRGCGVTDEDNILLTLSIYQSTFLRIS